MHENIQSRLKPELTAFVSVPRLAAIEYPLGYLLGQPGDREGQLTILRSTLRKVTRMADPGSITHLPFEWAETGKKVNNHPPKMPPISRYFILRPWLLPNLLSRDLPVKKNNKHPTYAS